MSQVYNYQNKDRQKLNDTKRRVINETQQIGGMSWVTRGREIENYIPAEAIGAYLKKATPKQVGQFTDFAKYLNGVKPGEGSRFKAGKPLFADRVCQHITRNCAELVLDLKERMDEVLKRIENWNK